MAHDPDRLARFQREARAVAALNHPNIVTIYSVEEADGVHFLTMELVEGQPLDRLIPASGLPIDQIVEIAGALADALAAAHEKGIVHRDLKPANVMVTNEGRVKVLDFGLAKDVRADNSERRNDDLGRPHSSRRGHGDASLHVAGTSLRAPARPPHRHLLPRRDAARDGDRTAPVRRNFFGRTDFRDPARHSTVGHRRSPGSARRSGAHHPPLPGKRPAPPHADGARCQQRVPRSGATSHRSRRSGSDFGSACRGAADSGAARADEGFWVAVLPFKYSGANQNSRPWPKD